MNSKFTIILINIPHRVEGKILYQNPLFVFEKKNPLRKIFRLEKNIPPRNIPDSKAEFRILGIHNLIRFLN